MGAWGYGSFENDDALDFIDELQETGDFGLVREIFKTVLSETEYLEAPEGCKGVAAAEIVAASLGHASEALQAQSEFFEWLTEMQPSFEAELIIQAREVLNRILAPDSELKELVEEGNNVEEWEIPVQQLIERLQIYGGFYANQEVSRAAQRLAKLGKACTGSV
jgi:hypothetical protein